MEAGRWAAQLEVAMSAIEGRDTMGPEAPSPAPVAAAASDGDPSSRQMAEDGRPREGGEDLGEWEPFALLVFRLRGHAFLLAKVFDAQGDQKGRIQFCMKCGCFCSG